MRIQKDIKTKVNNDWLQAFPELVAYTTNHFYKISGPLILGIELIKIPKHETYRPYFAIYPLWKESVKDCMDSPYKLIALKNKKGLQFDISYNKHSEYIEDAIKCMREQISISFEGNISLRSLFNTIEMDIYPMQIIEKIKVYLLKLYLFLDTNNINEMNKILLEIKINKEILSTNSFEYFFGSFDEWFSNLEKSLSNRDDFLLSIGVNKQDKKIRKMTISDIIA